MEKEEVKKIFKDGYNSGYKQAIQDIQRDGISETLINRGCFDIIEKQNKN